MHNQTGFSAVVIKAIDEERREITGIASTPQLDRVNDIVEPLGLTFGKDTPLLLNHNHAHPVGNVQFGTPTAKGLPFKATIAKVTEPGAVKDRTEESWHSVKAGLIKGVSIGFRPLASEPLGKGKGTRYTKADIHELSLVAIPANPGAIITAFKSLAQPSAVLTVTTKGLAHQFLNDASPQCANGLHALAKHLTGPHRKWVTELYAS
ncbi:HK97 family phage prohead protease [Burkholderia sp. S171]|uniref:HK97 family phage prohead protease n=1 Tax=Burkholderia sp. S171 TaxID=1641860 RepID=UPI00131AAC27|nr:HK97 family phage prohead protease [Burkholderia sp. S171]